MCVAGGTLGAPKSFQIEVVTVFMRSQDADLCKG